MCGCVCLVVSVCVANLIANQFVLILAAFLAHPLNNKTGKRRLTEAPKLGRRKIEKIM